MPPWLIPLLLEFLPQLPTLIGDGENVFNSVAHGEGGVAKVASALQGINTLATHATAAIGSATQTIAEVKAEQPPPPPPPSAAAGLTVG